MKTNIVYLILGLLVTVFGFLYVKTTFLDVRPTILTVVGEGKTKAIPEVAQFTVTYASTGKTSAETIDGEKILRDRLTNLLTGLYGLESSDVRLSYPKVTMQATTQGIIYQSVNTLDVNFRNLQTLDNAIIKLYQAGDISISNIIFTTSAARELEDTAITNAFTDGKTRAEKMAQASGKKLGRLVSVTGQQTQAVGTVSREVSNNKTVGTTPGQIELVRTVTLVYEIN